MLEKVFTELYERGIMLFLDIDSYCTNTVDINILKQREEFLQNFDEPIEKGYVFTFNTSLADLYKEIEEDSCAVIKYGFESDTDDKAHEVGRNFVEILNNNGFIIEWTESIKDKKIITIVITDEDIPFNEAEPNNSYLVSLSNDTINETVNDTVNNTDDNIVIEDIDVQDNYLVQIIKDSQYGMMTDSSNSKKYSEKIKNIKQEVLELIEKSNDKTYLDEMLTQSILQLDAIPSVNEDIKVARKNVIQYIQAEIEPNSGTREYKCTLCSKIYKQKKSFTKHIATHTNKSHVN
jgi:hypothetical protein